VPRSLLNPEPATSLVISTGSARYRSNDSGCPNAACSMNSEAFYNRGMKISARNKLRGTVETVNIGVVTAKVGVRVGDNLIESVITRESVEEMNIKVGQQVTAVIKSTEVMLMIE
jgi:molybdopterin-binding protein